MSELAHCAFWGLVATIVLTTLLSASQGLGFTRMNVPFLLGTMLTSNRDRAKVYGICIHLVNGILFAWLYLLTFQLWHGATWWKGATVGLLHASFILTCALPMLPAFHPRMATETEGPTVVRQLEPPGFMAMHYGWQTPISVVVSHVVFGIILGMVLPR